MTGHILGPRPASWFELGFAFLVGFGIGVVLTVAFGAGVAHAGGGATVTWDQGADCSSVTGWELLAAPITTAQPNPQPTAAAIGASIQNTGTPPCGLAMSKAVTLSGVGPTRFWIRAVAGATKSGESNSVDVSLPLAKPAGLTVVVP